MKYFNCSVMQVFSKVILTEQSQKKYFAFCQIMCFVDTGFYTSEIKGGNCLYILQTYLTYSTNHNTVIGHIQRNATI